MSMYTVRFYSVIHLIMMNTGTMNLNKTETVRGQIDKVIAMSFCDISSSHGGTKWGEQFIKMTNKLIVS